MNNQAAQTMPEPVTASMCPSSDYAKGWNDCLAALSQTAGVVDGPLSGKYGDVLRPFVIQMERELHANAGKGDRPGWLKMSPEVALLEIYYHLAKLQKAVKDDNGPGIQEYAADVANMSMMLLDICGGLALIEYAAPAASGGEDGWQRMTAEARSIQMRHLDDHHGDVYHAMQSLVVKHGYRSTGPMTQPIDTTPSAVSVSERARELEKAQRLAVSLWERSYRKSAPDWKVDDTLTGVLLQISNMVSGMSPRSTEDDSFTDLVVSLRDRAKWGRGGQFTSPHDSEGTSRLLDMAADALEQALTQQRGECEDARKFRRLAQLLDGFDFRLGRNALMPPATYLDSVEITCEFQPGIGQSVIDAIVDLLATEKRND